MTNVMIVENESLMALALSKRLERLGFRVTISVPTGEEALVRARENCPDLALLDINLGNGMDGIETAAILRDEFNIPFIYLTASVNKKTIQRAKDTGPYGYLIKPYDERELATTIEMALNKHKMEQEIIRQRDQLELLVKERTAELLKINQQLQEEIEQRKKVELELLKSHEKLSQAYEQTLVGWAKALEMRDSETAGHSLRVTELTLRLGKLMGLPQEELFFIRIGCLLHDIGKMGVPDGILLKPGQLTTEERLIMEKHPVYSYQMLVSIDYLQRALDIPYCHHERWDGNGYPQGLKGEEIPLAARLFAVVDVWDAVLSNRPYHQAWTHREAIELIRDEAGTHFDPQVVRVFLNMVANDGQLPTDI